MRKKEFDNQFHMTLEEIADALNSGMADAVINSFPVVYIDSDNPEYDPYFESME